MVTEIFRKEELSGPKVFAEIQRALHSPRMQLKDVLLSKQKSLRFFALGHLAIRRFWQRAFLAPKPNRFRTDPQEPIKLLAVKALVEFLLLDLLLDFLWLSHSSILHNLQVQLVFFCKEMSFLLSLLDQLRNRLADHAPRLSRAARLDQPDNTSLVTTRSQMANKNKRVTVGFIQLWFQELREDIETCETSDPFASGPLQLCKPR